MDRGTVVAALLAAVLAGGATGLGLHAWRPDPLGLSAADAGHPTVPASSPSTRATASPSGHRSASPPTSPAAGPGRSSAAGTSATPTTSAAPSGPPAFTHQALLQPDTLLANGWAAATVTKRWDGLPGGAMTPCAEITTGDTGVVEGYAARYASHHTGAVELVARYSSETTAARQYSELLNLIANCDASAYTPKVQLSGSARQVVADGVDDIRWWDTTGPGGERGVIGLVRAQNRLAYLSMSSTYSDPDGTHAGGTTDIAAVLTVAGKRLV